MSSTIQSLHALYCKLTGFPLSMRYDRERFWALFIKEGYTGEDLKLVIRHLQGEIHRGERRKGCLKFSNLIEPLHDFEEELALAKAYVRNNPVKTERKAVIEVFRPTVAESATVGEAKPAGEIAKKLIQQLRDAAR